MEMLVAARRELMGRPEITTLVGTSDSFSSWIFRWRLYVDVEGTSQCAIVLREDGGWASPNNHNTARFPRLTVEVYADPPRTPRLNPAMATAPDRAKAVFDVLDRVFHIPQGGQISWGDNQERLRIVSSLRLTEPQISTVSDGDGLARLSTAYAVTLG